MTRILWGGGVLIALAMILVGCAKASAEDESVITPPVLVDAAAVKTETKAQTRRYSGYVHPWESHGVGFMVPGRVRSINVKEGDYVEKGTLIATLSPEDYTLVSQLADIQQKAIEPNLERVDKLVQQNVLPQSQLDELKGRYDAAVTQHKQAKRQLAYTRLYAPIDGVVKDRRTSVGQVIAAGSPVVALLDLNKVKVKFGVTQRDLGYFTEGADVQVDFPGVVKGKQGKVYHVEFVADSKTRTYSVVVEVENEDKKIRPSMLAHLFVKVKEESGLFVPLYSVKEDRDGSHYIMVLAGAENKVEKRTVSLGWVVDESVKVLEGLAEGERVIVRGQEFVTPGNSVEVR